MDLGESVLGDLEVLKESLLKGRLALMVEDLMDLVFQEVFLYLGLEVYLVQMV